MTISTNDLGPSIAEAIVNNPITNILDTLNRNLTSAVGIPRPTKDSPAEDLFFEDFIRSTSSNPTSKNAFQVFLSQLAISPVACLLHTNGDDTLDTSILEFLSVWVDGPYFNDQSLESWVEFFSVALSGASDVDIWQALANIIKTEAGIMAEDSRSLGSVNSSYEDLGALDKFQGLIFPDTVGFFDTYFGGKEWSVATDLAFMGAKCKYSDGRWETFPLDADNDAVICWFTSFANYLMGATSRQYGQSPNKRQKSPGGKSNLFLYKSINDGDQHQLIDWSSVLVLCQLRKPDTNTLDPALLLQLVDSVRLVFESQNRRFVHAFTLCGENMRCWIFHRGGAFGSTEFSINKEPRLFVSVVMGYTMMNLTDLGFDPTLIVEVPALTSPTPTLKTPMQVTIRKPDGSKGILTLDRLPFFKTTTVVSRGTTCWKAKMEGDDEYKYVCKDSWRPYSLTPEGSMLAEAHSKGVKGVVEYVGHEDVQVGGSVDDITSNIMKGLSVRKPLNLKSQYYARNYPEISNISKKLRTGSSHPTNLPITAQKRAHPDSTSDNAPENNKKRRTGSQEIRPVYFNRIHSRLVTRQGRPIHKFTTNLELLEALRDAIAGHKSLLDHGILHRDISLNNIMITTHPRSDNFKGFLIDLDLSTKLHIPPTGHHAGTIEFMAIGVLAGNHHTYRHDLESFFYVFLWLCVHSRETPRSRWSRLGAWAARSYADAERIKWGDMDQGMFEGILVEFVDCAEGLKGLARNMRGALFPYRDGLFTGTDPDPEPLYEALIGHIQATIDAIAGAV